MDGLELILQNSNSGLGSLRNVVQKGRARVELTVEVEDCYCGLRKCLIRVGGETDEACIKMMSLEWGIF